MRKSVKLLWLLFIAQISVQVVQFTHSFANLPKGSVPEPVFWSMYGSDLALGAAFTFVLIFAVMDFRSYSGQNDKEKPSVISKDDPQMNASERPAARWNLGILSWFLGGAALGAFMSTVELWEGMGAQYLSWLISPGEIFWKFLIATMVVAIPVAVVLLAYSLPTKRGGRGRSAPASRYTAPSGGDAEAASSRVGASAAYGRFE